MADDDNDYDTHKDKPEGEGTQYRVSWPTYIIFAIFAWINDLISLIPGLNTLWLFPAQFILSLMWIGHGVFPWGKRRWIWYLVTWVAEFIPLVSMLPMYSFEAWRFFTISRIEDKVKRLAEIKKIDEEKAKAVAARFLKQKKVQDGVRKMQNDAVVKAGMQGRTGDDKYGRGAREDKRQRIADKKADLDKALQPDPNAKGKSNFSGIVDRKPGLKHRGRTDEPPEEQLETANDNASEPASDKEREA